MTRKLSPRALGIIHHAILDCNDAALRDEYRRELSFAARRHLDMDPIDTPPQPRHSLYRLTANGSDIMERLRQGGLLDMDGWLAERQEIFSGNAYEKNDLTIDLASLAMRVPEDLAVKEYSYNWRAALSEKAKPGGELEQAVKAAVKGTVGKPGVAGGFAIMLDKSAAQKLADDIFMYRPSLACRSEEIGQKTFTRVSRTTGELEEVSISAAPNNELPQHIRNWINLTKKLEPLGIDPDTVLLVRPEYNKMTAHILAEICNFPGASHYKLGCARGI